MKWIKRLSFFFAAFCLGIYTVVSVAAAQTPSTVTRRVNVYFDTPQQPIEVGTVTSLPLLINTYGREIDGLQVSWTLSGVTVSDVRFETTPELPFNLLKNEVLASNGSLYFIPVNPLAPFAASSSATLGTLYFTTMSPGTLTISYDQENTLVASSETSQNIAAVSSDQKVTVAGESTVDDIEVGTNDETGLAPEVTQTPDPATSPLPPAVLLIPIVIVLGLAALFFWRKQRSRRVTAEPTTPSIPEMPLTSVLPPQSPESPHQL
ncbi:MAG: hypothetical protein M3Q81_01140 [bacterium]|nr:hypothetical protein [bacterium]